MGDLDGDGRAARVDTVTDASTAERQRARRTSPVYALTTADPHHTLTQLLDQLGLRPEHGEPR